MYVIVPEFGSAVWQEYSTCTQRACSSASAGLVCKRSASPDGARPDSARYSSIQCSPICFRRQQSASRRVPRSGERHGSLLSRQRAHGVRKQAECPAGVFTRFSVFDGWRDAGQLCSRSGSLPATSAASYSTCSQERPGTESVYDRLGAGDQSTCTNSRFAGQPQHGESFQFS